MKTYTYPNINELESILQRSVVSDLDLEEVVKDVFENIQVNGDMAVSEYILKYDKIKLDSFFVSEQEIEDAEKELSEDLKNAIQTAASNIEKFHAIQIEKTIEVETMEGVRCWRKSVGIEKVGLYIPGGTAPLFSTVLMLGIPAKIAQCKEVILCTPADKNGKINPAILYTANLVGIRKIYKVGGIQAIAAMTFGTEIIPKVYKIFGPGNQYVTAAKQYAQRLKVAIDMPAGPSEVMVVCDGTANARFIAADLLSQAEHGADSQVVLVSTDEEKVKDVQIEIENQLRSLTRNAVARLALENSLAIITEKENVGRIINQYAPEHLILNTAFDDGLIPQIINAGSVFIGAYTPESAGDYASGTNHTLPTNGYARQYSGVSVDSFVKKITFQKISKEGLMNIGKTVELMAEAEGLDAHKNAITIRLNTLER